MAKSILIDTFSLCQNINSPEKFGIDAVGDLSNNENLYFCYVVDGHGGCKNSDILVQNFNNYVLSLNDAFAQVIDTEKDIYNFFEQIIKNFYIKHRGELRPAAMSILMVIFSNTQIYSANLGDCRLGKINKDQEISWITYPHSLAMSLNTHTDSKSIEILLRSYVEDNPVTKSFNTKKLKSLSLKTFDIDKNATYILASDGFWMLSENDYKTIVYNKDLSKCSVLIDDLSLCAISFI